jgi:hypothetical protein
MHKSATKCNETIGKWCKNKHGASKIIDTFETYQWSLCIRMKEFVVTANVDVLFVFFCDTCNIRDLIVDIFIPSSISLPTFPFIPSPWPCHMLQHWMKSHRVGLEYLSITRINKSHSWCIRLNILHWKPKRHLFSHRITEWRLIQSKLPLEVVIKHDLMV